MNSLVRFCLLLLVCAYVSSTTIPEQYCGRTHEEKGHIETCIKDVGEEDFLKMNEVGRECLEEHMKGVEMDPHYESMCKEISTEGGVGFQKCFESKVKEHPKLFEAIEKCMAEHGA